MFDFSYNSQKYVSVESKNEKNDDIDNVQKEQKFMDFIGQSEKMQQVFKVIDRIADTDSTILVSGKSGTGKELVARAIHQKSNRKNKPFVPINCGAIPESLLESELFGHVKGAFTGATVSKAGKFEIADGGTILLDEIGDMCPDLQIKLLRVLEEREFNRVGGSKNIKIDVRIVAATHRDLEKEVKKGNFREDLYYRLNVIPISLPLLRGRKSDIPLLISHFQKKFSNKNKCRVEGISDDAMDTMINYPWPGNVRELKNLIERIVVLKREGKIEVTDLPDNLTNNNCYIVPPEIEITKDGISLASAVNEFEKAIIFQSLERTKWVKNKAAELLQLKRTTLVEKIKRHHLKPQQYERYAV